MWIQLLALGLINGASSVSTPVVVPEQNSGGYEYLSRTQTKEERKKERQRLGIEPADIKKAIKKVAQKVVDQSTKPETYFFDRQAYFLQMLETELNGYRIPDMSEAIIRQIQIQAALRERDDEEAILFVMLN